MNKDPYKILGVAKTASQDDIRKAYRKLAKKHHPDLNPGDKRAEEQFKSISIANDLLSDSEKRARFDRGEIDIHGQEQGFAGGGQRYQQHGDGSQGFRYSQQGGPQGSFSEEDLQDIFSMFGGGAGRGPFQQGAGGGFRPQKGQDRRYNLDVNFIDAINGKKTRITLPGGGDLDVTIPSGIEDGQVLRLRGKGDAGLHNAPAGDALITVHVRSHAHFKREGRDIRLMWPMDLKTAILGGKVTVPTPKGEVSLNVPAHSDTGSVLRLKGRGLPAKGDKEAGNLYVSLQVRIGKVDPALEEFFRNSSNNDQK